MASMASDITGYTFTSSDRLLVDANVWMFVHGPTGPADRRAAVYSRALARILSAKSTIHADVLVLSEFINRHARLRYNIVRSTAGALPQFKDFRDSADFKPIAREIADAVSRILKETTRTESGFTSADVANLIEEYGKGGSDFNDQILVELCKSQGFTFVTDDKGFKGSGLSLITGNRSLLT